MDFCIGTCAKIDQVGLVKQAKDAAASRLIAGVLSGITTTALVPNARAA